MSWKKPGELMPLFDRLQDDEPFEKEENPVKKTYDVDQMRESVLRELLEMLDTRVTFNKKDFKDVDFYEKSVFGLKCGYPFFYGISDFSFYDISNAQGKQSLEDEIRTAIEIFEPRLENVTIKVQETSQENQSISLQLGASLKVGEILDHFTFPILIEKGIVKSK